MLRNLVSPCDRSDFGALRHYRQDHHDILCVLNVLSLCVFKKKKKNASHTHAQIEKRHITMGRDSPKINGQVRYYVQWNITVSRDGKVQYM